MDNKTKGKPIKLDETTPDFAPTTEDIKRARELAKKCGLAELFDAEVKDE